MTEFEVQALSLLKQIAENTKPKTRERQQKMDIAEICPGVKELVSIWNEWKELKMPAVGSISPGSLRYKNAKARWLEKPDKEYWIKVVKRVNESLFCNGDNNRKWIADFEFLVRPDQHNRILEGKFDRCHLSGKVKPGEKKIVGYFEGQPVYG